jgi:hypothetical protein
VPIAVERDDTRRRLTVTATGLVDFETMATFVSTARPGDLRSYTLLFDGTAATFGFSYEQVRTLAARLGELRATGPRGRVAIVAPSDGSYGVMRIYETLAQGVGVDYMQVFRSRDLASQWLEEPGQTQP